MCFYHIQLWLAEVHQEELEEKLQNSKDYIDKYEAKIKSLENHHEDLTNEKATLMEEIAQLKKIIRDSNSEVKLKEVFFLPL